MCAFPLPVDLEILKGEGCGVLWVVVLFGFCWFFFFFKLDAE